MLFSGPQVFDVELGAFVTGSVVHGGINNVYIHSRHHGPSEHIRHEAIVFWSRLYFGDGARVTEMGIISTPHIVFKL